MAALGVTGVAPETVALWDAVDDGDEAKVREVVAAGASTSAANRMGLSSLHRAAAAGSVSIATVLAAELGAPIDKPDRAGSTALVVAAGRGHEAVVRALLRLGADVSPARDDGTRALHLACAGGHVGSALAIVRARGGDAAGAGAKDKQGCTPAEHLAQASARNADPADLTELRALLAAAEAATPGPPSAEADTDPPASPPPSPPPPVPPARSAAVTPPPAAPSTEAAALDETEAPAAPNGRQPPPLTPAEGRRYSRHLLLPQVAVAGQLALKRARVLVVGAGANKKTLSSEE
ncbi:ankyrin repeat-containing domain protein [Pavlovales sp. CCMP2436]|nr:ankyrin repeat-containing domain protein [Pavlovales sp. CCMP2436]